MGHAGHGCAGKNSQQVFSLEDQINHKIDILEHHSSTSSLFRNNNNNNSNNNGNNNKGGEEEERSHRPPFILIGHSVGSYIALKV